MNIEYLILIFYPGGGNQVDGVYPRRSLTALLLYFWRLVEYCPL